MTSAKTLENMAIVLPHQRLIQNLNRVPCNQKAQIYEGRVFASYQHGRDAIVNNDQC